MACRNRLKACGSQLWLTDAHISYTQGKPISLINFVTPKKAKD